MSDSPAVIGIDGCPGGWVGARIDAEGALTWLVLPLGLPVAKLAEQANAVAIDIPIGLPASGRRAADLAAKAFLGAAASSVFFTPARQVLSGVSYAEACVLARQATGKAISQQTWGILPRIRAVDESMTPRLQDRIIEAHPEVSFRTLSTRVTDGKKTGRGVGQRIAALRGFVDAVEALTDGPPGIPLDDLLDALACAWTARRWSMGDTMSFPRTSDEYDERGLRMKIMA